MAISSRVKRFLIARVKRSAPIRRRPKSFWVKVGKKVFFFKKGHNQRMGKGIGSYSCSRRVIRAGELLLALSAESQKVLRRYKSYINARVPGLLHLMTSSEKPKAFMKKGLFVPESIQRRRPAWFKYARSGRRNICVFTKSAGRARYLFRRRRVIKSNQFSRFLYIISHSKAYTWAKRSQRHLASCAGSGGMATLRHRISPRALPVYRPIRLADMTVMAGSQLFKSAVI